MIDPKKHHGIELNTIKVPDGAISLTEEGEPAVTAGILGSGKLIPSNTTGGPDMLILGSTKAKGKEPLKSKDE